MPQARKTGYVMPLVVGCGAFLIGIGLTVGYIQWQDQKQQLARMTQILEGIQGQDESEAVTRNAPLALSSVAPIESTAVVAPTPAALTPEPTQSEAVVAAPAVADTAPEESTADRILALVSRPTDPLVNAAIAREAARRETMSVAIQGVNELVKAATAGEFTLDTEARSGGAPGGILRISFPKNARDQAQLEWLLSSAAETGMIAVSDAVKGSDGSYDGRVILFDLVERALSNGTPEERRTAQSIQQQAVKLLADDTGAVVTAASENAAGERFYTVEAGDSLAYIALQFYGNTNGYLKIFRANQGKLSSPEKIQIGQRLLIPAA